METMPELRNEQNYIKEFLALLVQCVDEVWTYYHDPIMYLDLGGDIFLDERN